MEFTDDNKQTILNLLKSGQRQAAVNFIANQYRVSLDDAQKLLTAFEIQFRNSVAGDTPVQTASTSGCSGCLSGALKAIAVLLGFLGLASLGVAYYAPELLGSMESNIDVPVKVIGKFYTQPDSLQERLIFEVKGNGKILYDTGNTIYSAGMYYIGDTLRVSMDQLNLPIDLANSKPVNDAQLGIYIFAGVELFIAFIFWIVGSKFQSKKTITVETVRDPYQR